MIPFAALPPLLSRYWHFAVIGGLSLALGVQTARIASLKADIAQEREAVAKEYTKAAVGVILKERAAARISEEKALSYEKSIADLRAAAAKRLQAYTGKPTALPSVPDAAFRVNEKACGDGFSITSANAVALMLAADENTRQLMDLQDWLREQAAASRL
ncbi:hypothetical protein [Sphingomonas sp. SRS2]|uniref:hypothetical protein n=1 Tax=Sphingomonas sp. SRS2 TaxID=133190 RepID=UPI0006184650|nr:hypothetical protein [Sphingomonas sp. SRS2]KKC27328.1 hypothetical protein WP12_04065 [Sphingomonas sp. SRS2]